MNLLSELELIEMVKVVSPNDGDVFERRERKKEPKSLLYEMKRNGVHPDSLLCRVVVEGYENESKLLSALNLLFEIPISADIDEYLVDKLCEENRPFVTKSLLERISPYGYVPSQEPNCLCKINKSMKGEYVMKEMVKFVVPPDTAICKALINGYIKEMDIK
ncbi:pentatricopeptide repeat-containing protein [Quercus suber]|uniref:Pentatricopeptide repeat-containing protein n=1 Tax=Quercus suber TaxID=58331 RepID=A0AAW0JZ43_QUESU